jgi:glycine/D-amino acid oxidase-like deaminating enzyme
MAAQVLTGSAIFAPGFKEQPYWWEAAAPPPAVAPDLPERVDVAIVGGGYCGLNAALELARRGASVAVLEGERIGFGASSRNGGMVSGGIKLASMNLETTLGTERAQQLVSEAMSSLPFVEELIQREGIDADYKRSGRFLGAWCDAHFRSLQGQVELYRKLTGMRADALGPERQREEIGSDYYRGGLVADAFGSLHPAKYHQGLARVTRAAGAHLIDGTRVTAVKREDGGFRVATARGSLQAKDVFVATNGYTGDVTPWMRRRVIPVGSYMLATEPLEPAVAKRILPNGRMISDTKRVMAYYRLSPDGTRVLFGGRASFRQVSALTAAPVLHARMCEVWPELGGTRITHAWTGNVAFTFDFLPHMGTHEGVHYALGCQGSGVAMMSYLGYQTALKLAGGANRTSAFDGLDFPTKPLYSGQPWFLPIVGWSYRMRDWLDRRAA